MKQENHLRQNFLKISIQKKKPKILNNNIGSTYKVADLETKPTKNHQQDRLLSTLQQEAARKLYLPVGITMQLAQRLYEAGLITYMRTECKPSKDAMEAAQAEIIKSYGKEFSKPRTLSIKVKQEAHEAIRPTDMSRHTVNIDRDQARLYDLI
jgi:DNA topoisomerase-1